MISCHVIALHPFFRVKVLISLDQVDMLIHLFSLKVRGNKFIVTNDLIIINIKWIISLVNIWGSFALIIVFE